MLIQRLFSFPGRKVTTFDAMKRLDETLGQPHKSFRSVHVGGTNGKGSVSLKIATALQAEGYRVGLYTSPHIADFRERIQIDGRMIGKREAEPILERLFSLIHEELSFFDLLTAMAFLYFKEQKVDWAVIEVGIGGRLDSTNVIAPKIAAITSIGFDHMQILGNTLEAIAREKGGISKPGVPLIVGPTASGFFPGAIATTPQPFYDLENQGVARAVLEKLGISEQAISQGLKMRPLCRFDVRGNFILDVAHNPDGFQKLTQALRLYFPDEKFHFIVAFMKDKDWRSCIDLIRPLAFGVHAFRGHCEKLIPPEEIGINVVDSVRGFLGREEKVVVCGSFYIMDEVLKQIS
jgi:dihydrofolate synthase/folylpolyglutamate synthase